MIDLEKAEEVRTKHISRAGKDTPVLSLSTELKWLGLRPGDRVVILKIGDEIVIRRKD